MADQWFPSVGCRFSRSVPEMKTLRVTGESKERESACRRWKEEILLLPE
jgi:hypothetical protein